MPDAGDVDRRGALGGLTRRRFLKYSGVGGASGIAAVALAQAAYAADTAVKIENQNAGAIPDVWESDRDPSIVGFTTQYSYLPGETVTFKINTDSTSYRIRIFRIGWYGGLGARFIQDVTPSVPLPQTQPNPDGDGATGLWDCGKWAPSAQWTIPAGAVSGIYYARFERSDSGTVSNHTIFVVRRNGPSDILVQTSEMTMHAYNRYGGNSLYYGDPVGRAYKVSYNRPFGDGDGSENDFFNAEVALVRFLERNGYDVAYCGGIDVHRDASVLAGRKVFISSGHDEYVSREQREHVTAARDAGTHLIFMTGNEYFWKVRFEPSIDGSNTPDRTMVCYKETLDSAKIDPSAEWTGTWRDPRFSPPSNGGRPENSLTGQLFRAILPTSAPDLNITVPADYRRLRFWRNTAVATLANGAVRTLAPSTLGYEFDVDADNGSRPPGLIRLSETTASAPQLLLDYGATYAPGTCVHTMTLYRAASGALVWGTGTVQWAYGLDSYHVADSGTPTDPVMQQATVNMLADMGAQPTSLMSGLVPAAASADTLPPTVSVVMPDPGTAQPIGSPVTIAGTAVDSGGGVVAGVEVSVDNGATWHPAVGRESWSYVYTPLTLGTTTVLVRAIDDSANIGPSTALPIVGAPRPFPMSIWPAGTAPGTPATNDAGAIECGVRFRASVDAFVTGIRFYKGAGNTGTHTGSLWTNGGQQLATQTFTNESATGWQVVSIPPVAISAGQTYIASVFMPAGHYAADAGYFQQAYDLPPLRALANGEDGANGVYRYGSAGFPTSTFGSTNYWVDLVLSDDNAAAPTVLSCAPAPDLAAVSPAAAISATFSEGMTPGSVQLTVSLAGGAAVAGSTAYDAASRTATFTPSAQLGAGKSYTAVVTGSDSLGNPMAAPYSWSFTVDGGPGTSPATLWDSSAVPASISAETSPLELGTRFVSSRDASVTALRFYKVPGSQGPHTGHLWGPSQELLATVTYGAETASGWQQAALTTPVAITKGTQYTVSYYCPAGQYGATAGLFSGSGARVREPLTAPSEAVAGGNGVYRYGSSAYPSSSNGACYWADVVVTLPPDTTAPTVVDLEPGADLVAVDTATAVRATFSEPVDPASVQLTLTKGSSSVTGSVGYDAASQTATFTPSAALAAGVTYQASVTAADLAGNPMAAPRAWSFTTDGDGTATLWISTDRPDTPASSDAGGVEVGVRFRAAGSGSILGLRFYKGLGNDGPHVGRLWTAAGALLGSVSFDDETASGWQQARFSTPIAISGGTDYVASYYAPSGHYAVTGGGLNATRTRGPLTAPATSGATPNGVFAYGGGGFPSSSYNGGNYWVDVLYVDNSGPSVVAQEPAPGETGVPVGAVVSATFDEAVATGTLSMKLRDAGGGLVAGTVAYDGATRVATFTPSAPLAAGGAYSASVESAADAAGNQLGAPVSWSFTTASATVTTLWPANTVPATVLANDQGPIELGVRLQTSVAGTVTAIRFYKGGTQNTGPHVANLWDAAGTLLASATTSGESARGWQSVTLPTPVPLTPGAVYTASYFAGAGYYSMDAEYFNTGPRTSGPLTALANTGAGNGVFRYGAASGYPTGTYNGSNYWVDVVFTADAP
ncbi:DUF4082 domain-containing protein [Cumulibacter manganitolerans]|uniref:DUF4082 domain-containing protein n=1 Tax=Cumulibacter manganitolerans TaxID=1884992 RepID=UPI0012972304|nr:DUF4082 domain-containing protein [Cumulibacter manganitolerans]